MDLSAAQAVLDFVEAEAPGLRGFDGKSALARIELRLADVNSALGAFVCGGRTDEALRMITALAYFWMAAKRLDEGRRCFEKALGAPGGSDSLRGQALFHLGMTEFWSGDDAAAMQHFEDAKAVGERAGDKIVQAQALTGIARVALRSDVAQARRLCLQALALSEGSSDVRGVSHAWHVLGVAAQMAGDFTQAREMIGRRVDFARATADQLILSSELGNLSMVERQLGNLDAARALATEALEIAMRRSDGWMVPLIINSLAAIAADRGECERGARLLGAVEALLEAQNAAWPPDELQQAQRTIALLTSRMGHHPYETVRDAGKAMGEDEAVAYALSIRTPRSPSAHARG